MGNLSLQTKWSKIILRFPYCQTWRHPFSIVIVTKDLWNTLIKLVSKKFFLKRKGDVLIEIVQKFWKHPFRFFSNDDSICIVSSWIFVNGRCFTLQKNQKGFFSKVQFKGVKRSVEFALTSLPFFNNIWAVEILRFFIKPEVCNNLARSEIPRCRVS